MQPAEEPVVTSRNFEFLRPKRAVLADMAGLAEGHAYTDPVASLAHQRKIAEVIVRAIYQGARLPPLYTENLNDLLNADAFREAVPTVVQNKLHLVRKSGNDALHGNKSVSQDLSLDTLRQLFDAATWLHLVIDGGKRADFSAYESPTPPSDRKQKAKEATEKAQAIEAQYAALLATLEEERKKRQEAESASQASAAELAQLKAEGQKVASVLQFNEATTRRRLIDRTLVEAGWDVGANGADTDHVRQEVSLFAEPGEGDAGRADYVLYGDDGKPLAVVEAKKTAKDARSGAEQARLYAVCLEKMTGVRPAIFFTNGGDIFFWDDAQGPWRKVYGFYSKDSLEYLAHQRANKKPLGLVEPNNAIAGRMYQLEAIKRVTERFEQKFRKALVVQATGTGKTRVAVSLCDVLLRAGWAKRILFLCDRKELRRQADRVFKEFLPGEPRVVVGASTAKDRDKRIYLATYPAMMQCYEDFDVGFFDLIVADESHRSIYNRYRSLFLHFDALEVGLTATPVKFIERNTFGLFGCEDGDPTAHYSYEKAVEAKFLVPFRVRAFGSRIREKGLRYSQMNEAQREQLEAQESAPQLVEFEPEDTDKKVFNKGTTRDVWAVLMAEGIREGTGSRVGKTIVFARNHLHAVHLAEVFADLYPSLGSSFCRVIDNQEPRADQLLDDFKDPANDLTIAISVDMLDTGVDVPEVVNLVFCKPVKSYVKFWQMIGRGTRLSKDLFGAGRDKSEFLIFDHYSNFWFFDEKYKEKEPAPAKSLLQRLFEARVTLAELALDKLDDVAFQATADILASDVTAAREAGSIDVRDKWKELHQLDRDRIGQFSAATKADLLSIAAPLMMWRDIRGDEEAYRFDLLTTALQLELLKGGPTAQRFLDLRDRLREQVELLMKNQNPVKAKAATIQAVRGKELWSSPTVATLDEVRQELRGIMKYQVAPTTTSVAPRVFDVEDTDFRGEDYVPKREGLELVEYKRRVEQVLRKHFKDNPTLQRIREGKAVQEKELEALAKLVLEVDDRAQVKHLAGHDPKARRSLLDVFRGLVGLDAAAVAEAFTAFVHKHPRLSAQQLQFLQLLQNHIAQNGGIEIDRLYDPPFTTIHAESVDGVFPAKGDVDDLLAILAAFEPKKATPTDPPPASQAS